SRALNDHLKLHRDISIDSASGKRSRIMRSMDRLIGLWLGFAVFLQALLIAAIAPMSRAQALQFLLGAICLMLLVTYLWRSRLYLNSHVDMLLIMFASGGLGMLLGMSSHMSHAADF